MHEEACVSRRFILQGAFVLGASALIGGAATMQAFGDSAEDSAQAAGAQGVQYGFLVDASRCVNCEKCIDACRAANALSGDTPDRRRITAIALDNRGNEASVSTSCMHCADPSCARVCPAGAIAKGEGGIVSVDKGACIGCKYCYQACPYDVPRYNAQGMDKCDCCLGAGVAPGETPYCVKACIFNALKYGPIEELKKQAPDAVVIASVNNPSCLIRG